MTAKSSTKGGSKHQQARPVKVPMTPDRAAAIQSHTMKTTGAVKSGSFAAVAQSTAARNVNVGIVPNATTGKP